MVRVKGEHWTADFTIARALAESYRSSGKEGILYFCVGDPHHIVDSLGPNVGKELLKYYPHVAGTPDSPILTQDLVGTWRQVQQEWPNAFVIGIEVTEGPQDSVGFIEVNGRGIRRRPAGDESEPWICDVAVSATLYSGEVPTQLTPPEYNRMLRISDAIVDGQIRFLQKVKMYQPDL